MPNRINRSFGPFTAGIAPPDAIPKQTSYYRAVFFCQWVNREKKNFLDFFSSALFTF
jgi:hypothetical protein